MRQPVEELHNDGVFLRRWRSDDADALLEAVDESREHVAPWMSWATSDYGRRDAVTFLERSDEQWRDGVAFNFAILSPHDGVIGSISLMARIGPGGLEIGYWLHPAYTGRGIVTRAVADLAEEAFRIGAERVEIVHDVANTRSGAIPRRLGFTEVERRSPPQEALTPGEDGVDVVWRCVAREWLHAQATHDGQFLARELPREHGHCLADGGLGRG